MVISLGSTGELRCLDTVSGALKWNKNVFQDHHTTGPEWGHAASPLVVDDLIIVAAGRGPEDSSGPTLAAYESATGKSRWAAGIHSNGYSSPRLVTLAGTCFVIYFDGGGISGYDPQSGMEKWRHPWPTMMSANTMQPLVIANDQLFLSSESDRGAALIRVKAPSGNDATWSTEEVWQTQRYSSRFSCPVTDGETLFGLSHGLLTALDTRTGERLWKEGRYGLGQTLLLQRHLIISTDRGEIIMVDANREHGKELARFRIFDGKTWNMPAIAGNRLFLRNQKHLACVALPLSPSSSP
jgi:outer membrane protein assembly factor BamB